MRTTLLLSLSLLLILAHTQYNESLSETLSHLSLVAQCKIQNIATWTCEPCKRYPSMTNVHVFKNPSHDIVGYIGTSQLHDAIFLVFRGTLAWDWKNWFEDINYLKTKYKRCDNGCSVHRGFYEAYREIENEVEQYILKYNSTYSMANLYVTGHSLGGALAYLSAAHLFTLGFNITAMYTQGSPRVGDHLFRDWFTRANNNKFIGRVTNYQDPVPHLPYQNWGFQHISTQVYYDKGFKSYKVCNDSVKEDPACSDSIKSYNAHDHETYFGIEWMDEAKACFFIKDEVEVVEKQLTAE